MLNDESGSQADQSQPEDDEKNLRGPLGAEELSDTPAIYIGYEIH